MGGCARHALGRPLERTRAWRHIGRSIWSQGQHYGVQAGFKPDGMVAGAKTLVEG